MKGKNSDSGISQCSQNGDTPLKSDSPIQSPVKQQSACRKLSIKSPRMRRPETLSLFEGGTLAERSFLASLLSIGRRKKLCRQSDACYQRLAVQWKRAGAALSPLGRDRAEESLRRVYALSLGHDCARKLQIVRMPLSSSQFH